MVVDKKVPQNEHPNWPELSRPVANFCLTHGVKITADMKKLIQDQDDSLFDFDGLLAFVKGSKANTIWFFEDIDKLMRAMKIIPTRA